MSTKAQRKQVIQSMITEVQQTGTERNIAAKDFEHFPSIILNAHIKLTVRKQDSDTI